jgi:outer membrane immunogenic protein
MNNRAFTIAALVSGAAGLAPIASAQAADWTGFYFGAGAGYSMKSDDSETLLFDTDRDGNFDDTVFTAAPADAFSPGFCTGAAQGRAPADGCRETDDDINYSLRAGYDWQAGNWVYGAVGEYSVQNIGDDVSGFSTTPASYTFSRDLNSIAALRGRMGYAFDNSLVYATGGWAWGDMDRTFSTTNGANSFTPSGDDDADGYQLGAGYEWKLPDTMMGAGWSLGVEYLWTSLDDGDYQVAVGPGTAGPTNPFLIVDPTGTDMKRSNDDFEFSSVGVTLNWRQ